MPEMRRITTREADVRVQRRQKRRERFIFMLDRHVPHGNLLAGVMVIPVNPVRRFWQCFELSSKGIPDVYCAYSKKVEPELTVSETGA
jgi:hypothetical protein